MRLLIVTLVTVAALSALSTAEVQAQQTHGWDSFWHKTGLSAKRMNHYPEPFIYADRDAARLPFAIMVQNGCQLQNTLGGHYFNQETQELTRAGELKVRSIISQSPDNYRTVHVVRGHNEDVTAIRVDSVQQSIARAIPSGALPDVVETGTELRGTPGEYVDSTYRNAQSGRPAPVLPAAAGPSN